MQSRIINPEITSLKDEILKIITKLLPSNPSELSTIIPFITFLEGVYLGKNIGRHMPENQLEFETIYYEFKRVLTFLKSPPPDTQVKLINFSKEIKFAACINHHIVVNILGIVNAQTDYNMPGYYRSILIYTYFSIIPFLVNF